MRNLTGNWSKTLSPFCRDGVGVDFRTEKADGRGGGEFNYEEAARLRDRIAALEHALEKQNVDWGGTKDQDVVGVYAHDDNYQLCILFVRGGKLLGSKSFAPVKMKMDLAEIISSCLTQYYDGDANIPDEIIIPCHLPDEAVIVEWLTDKKKEKKVVLTITFSRNKECFAGYGR